MIVDQNGFWAHDEISTDEIFWIIKMDHLKWIIINLVTSKAVT